MEGAGVIQHGRLEYLAGAWSERRATAVEDLMNDEQNPRRWRWLVRCAWALCFCRNQETKHPGEAAGRPAGRQGIRL